MSITFSSCFYIIKSKFQPEIYIEWMNNFLSIVNNFNLVIYTDERSVEHIKPNNNPKIKIIIKPLEQFYNYKYKDYWISNHSVNSLLNDKSCWELNMLWSEKIFFVKETIERKHFETDFYGWCDIGYFRNRETDLHTSKLNNWGNIDLFNEEQEKTKNSDYDKNKISYSCICNNDGYVNYLYQLVNNKNEKGLPIQQIPAYQNSIAGGFFVLHKDNINWLSVTYNKTLERYFTNNYLVKDDQIILVDCIFSNIDKFNLFRENNSEFDNWFMFQRILN